MKRLILGLLILFSLSSFASEGIVLRIVERTTGEQVSLGDKKLRKTFNKIKKFIESEYEYNVLNDIEDTRECSDYGTCSMTIELKMFRTIHLFAVNSLYLKVYNSDEELLYKTNFTNRSLWADKQIVRDYKKLLGEAFSELNR